MEIKEKINLKRLNSVLKKNSLKIIIILFLFTLCGYFYSYNFVVPKYKSTSTILLASNNLNKDTNTVTQTDVNLNKNLISTYGKILKSNNVLGQVITNLKLDVTKEELYKNIQIEEVEDTQIIEIGVINESAIEAQEILTELNKVFIEEIKQIYKLDNINIVDEPSFELVPYNVNHVKDISIFFLAGSVFSLCMIAIIYFFDTTIKIEQDIEEFIGLNVIGTVPKHKSKDKNAEELIVQNNSKSVISEALKTIRTNISFTKTNGTSRSILFTSCNSGEGKSWIASNMAVAYAQSNKNVIIVDADMRKGRQHNIFKVKNTNGLSNCLREIKNNEDYETLENYIQETQIPKVHIITIGAVPPNPSELLLSSKMNDLVHMLKCIYDVVIIDGTPCNLVSDSIPVSQIVDTTILVTESRKTKIEDLKNVVKSIKNAQGNIEGIILNKKEIKNKEYGKGYYYGEKSNNAKIEITSHSVKELIENRKNYTEVLESLNENRLEKQENENITLLAEKIEGLEEKLLKLPDMNLESYTKIVEDIRQIYDSEIDKNKLAEDIKENIIKNELVKKLNESNIETKSIIEQKLEELDYKNEIKGLIDKVDSIENAIDNDVTEEKITKMISKLKEEQDRKLQELDSSKVLNQILEKIEEQNEEIEKLDSSEILNQIIQKIEEQNEKIKDLDSSRVLNNIVLEMKKLNTKYEKVNSIEKIVSNDKTEENIEKMIDKMKKDNERKLEKIDNTAQIKEIMKELKKINNKYEKLVENLKQKSKPAKKTQVSKQEKTEKTHKNNVIEMSEIKEKLNQKELSIEYGSEINYEQLLDLAVEVYEIKPNESKAI